MDRMLGLSDAQLRSQFYNADDLDRVTNSSYHDMTRNRSLQSEDYYDNTILVKDLFTHSER